MKKLEITRLNSMLFTLRSQKNTAFVMNSCIFPEENSLFPLLKKEDDASFTLLDYLNRRSKSSPTKNVLKGSNGMPVCQS